MLTAPICENIYPQWGGGPAASVLEWKQVWLFCDTHFKRAVGIRSDGENTEGSNYTQVFPEFINCVKYKPFLWLQNVLPKSFIENKDLYNKSCLGLENLGS